MSLPGERIRREHTVDASQAGLRVDQVAAAAWPDYSRSRLSAWIRAGDLRVDGREVKPNRRMEGGERLELDTLVEAHPDNPEPEPMPIAVLHADADVFVIDKPAGLVVHPGSGNTAGTLVNGLLHLDAGLASLPRAGLVHRLDKDTSGCLVVARSARAHAGLVQALKRREISRRYVAVVWGRMIAGGSVDAPLGRHSVDRRRQVVREDGRRAVTHYRVRKRLAGSTLIDVALETGRTHQIRVHMQHAGFPLIGDPVYGRRGSPAGLSETQRETWRGFPRQALHAERLEFTHPVSGEAVAARAPIPADLQRLIDVLDPGDE